jgi:hypothetical protein
MDVRVHGCGAGHYCPAGTGELTDATKCSSPTGFCPQGSSAINATSAGFYALATLSGLFFNQSVCEAGRFCLGGVAYSCPLGRFGAVPALVSDNCTGVCDAGYYCGPASVSARQEPCGGAGVFCPQVRRGGVLVMF